jgi:hypothetical protein
MVTGETAHHLNVLVRMLTNMLGIDAKGKAG